MKNNDKLCDKTSKKPLKSKQGDILGMSIYNINHTPRLNSCKSLDMSFSNMEKQIEKDKPIYKIKMDNKKQSVASPDRNSFLRSQRKTEPSDNYQYEQNMQAREYWVYVPATRPGEKEESYPVLYLLDGDSFFHSVVGFTRLFSTARRSSSVRKRQNCPAPPLPVYRPDGQFRHAGQRNRLA